VNFIRREWRALACAMQFLTRIPLATRTIFDNKDYANSLAWYPVIGLVLGGLVWLSGVALAGLSSTSLTAALVLAVWVLLTGALHLDGVADCADAWVGGFGDREKTFQILKDPRSGPIAVVVLVLVLLIKWAALEVLLGSEHWSIIWLIPLLARGAMPYIFWRLDYVRSSGLGAAFVEGLSRQRILISLLFLVVIAVLSLTGQLGILVLFVVVSLLIYLWWKRASYQKLGGFNGDCAGALVEFLELGLLFGLAIYTGSSL
jgi:adenosylcobinamide-GDP ribazoletransferase|tara:strand:- start:3399 stop:4178 length:780 start_codon:yes stop_codon:yes gene_type:complete